MGAEGEVAVALPTPSHVAIIIDEPNGDGS